MKKKTVPRRIQLVTRLCRVINISPSCVVPVNRTFFKHLVMDAGSKKVPDDIGKIKVTPLKESIYMKPFRAEFTMNGKQRYWDFLKIHDSVAILIYNITRKVLVLVRQFRPALYLAQVKNVELGSEIDASKLELYKGYSYELCAGLIDKNAPVEVIAKEEVLEECGYDVPVSSFKKIFSFRNVGITGQKSTLYYVEVTDEQKVSQGGGLRDEGESIEVVELTIDEVKKYIQGVDLLSPPMFAASIQWFLRRLGE